MTIIQEIIELENHGYRFFTSDDKLQYQYCGKDKPGESVSSLFATIKTNKPAAIAFLQSRYADTRTIIAQAYRGQLTKAVMIQPLPDWRHIWPAAVWLVPDERTKERIRAKCPDALVTLPSEFFLLCQSVLEHGQEAKFVFDAFSLFGGQLLLDKDAIQQNDPGADISPSDSELWLMLLDKAREFDIDLHSRLLYLRGVGCKLVPDSKTGLRIIPVVDPTGKAGWTSLEEFECEKWCLSPYIKQVSKLLKELAGENN